MAWWRHYTNARLTRLGEILVEDNESCMSVSDSNLLCTCKNNSCGKSVKKDRNVSQFKAGRLTKSFKRYISMWFSIHVAYFQLWLCFSSSFRSTWKQDERRLTVQKGLNSTTAKLRFPTLDRLKLSLYKGIWRVSFRISHDISSRKWPKFISEDFETVRCQTKSIASYRNQ